MKNYKFISSLTILTVAVIASSQAQADASRCRAAHKECDGLFNLYGLLPEECHSHVEKHYGCPAEESIVASPVVEETVVAPASTTTLPAAEIATTTDTVDTNFGGNQGDKGFRNTIEGSSEGPSNRY